MELTTDNLLWSFSVVGEAALLARLFILGLYRTYRWLSAYLMIDIAEFLLLAIVPAARRGFPYFFAVAQPVAWAFEGLVLLEIYSLVLRNHAGFARWGRRLIGISFATSIALSTL